MAERRMFAKSIVLSDAFLDMPATTRCLYFTLSMLADDDGFVGNARSIMRQCMATDDDMKLLIAKRYVLAFESGVVVIKHWLINNYLQNDRKKNTTYLEEKETLMLDGKGAYTEKEPMYPECIQNVYKVDTQVSIGKNSIDYINKKESIEKKATFVAPTLQEVEEYVKDNNLNVNPNTFVDFYESKGWMVGKTKMKDWKAACRRWSSTEKKEKPKSDTGSFETNEFFNQALNRTYRKEN